MSGNEEEEEDPSSAAAELQAELQEGWSQAPVEEWPEEAPAGAEQASLAEVQEEDFALPQPEEQAGGVASSSGGPATAAELPTAVGPPGAANSSTGGPASSGASGTVAVQVPIDVMAGVSFSPPPAGHVTRHGKLIGRLTRFKNSLSIYCYMHGCAQCVSAKVPDEAGVAWIVQGQEVPDSLPVKEQAAKKRALKALHMQVPKPVKPN